MGLFGDTDITFCDTRECVLRKYCRRGQWPKDDGWLAIAKFPLNPDGSCDHMLEIKK